MQLNLDGKLGPAFSMLPGPMFWPPPAAAAFLAPSVLAAVRNPTTTRAAPKSPGQTTFKRPWETDRHPEPTHPFFLQGKENTVGSKPLIYRHANQRNPQKYDRSDREIAYYLPP